MRLGERAGNLSTFEFAVVVGMAASLWLNAGLALRPGGMYSRHYTNHGKSKVITIPTGNMPAMQKKQRLSLRDLEQEAEKFLKPTTPKEQAIIEAASALLGERGIDGATTAEIAKRAGVTERTLFRYFPSKNDLVRRVLFPPLLHGALTREWEKLEALLAMEEPDLKTWYTVFTTQRVAVVGKNAPLVRTLLI